MQRGARQEIALVLRQQMPDQDGQLARCRDSCHMLTPPGPHPKEKGSQGTWCSRRCPGRLNQHPACMSASLLRDPPMVGRPRSGLPDAWIETEVAGELLRPREALDISNRRLDGQRDDHMDAWNRHQQLDAFLNQCRAGQITLDHFEILAEPVELTQMPLDSETLVLGHPLRGKPGAALSSTPVR